jgi:hypothetical protein
MTELWDEPLRGERYSIVTKRRQLDRFLDDPTELRLKRFAGTLWAYDAWATVDFPVEERMLDGYDAEDFRDFIRGVEAGEISTGDPDTPNLGTWVMSEIMEAIDPSNYATLNDAARTGLQALGYPTPGKPMDSFDEYWDFVDHTNDAVEQYDLRDRVERALPEVPDDVLTVDIAQAAFQLHGDDEFDLDLAATAATE